MHLLNRHRKASQLISLALLFQLFIVLALNLFLYLTPFNLILNDYFAYYQIYSGDYASFLADGKDVFFAYFTEFVSFVFGPSKHGYLMYRQLIALIFFFFIWKALLNFQESSYFEAHSNPKVISSKNDLLLLASLSLFLLPIFINSSVIIFRSGISAAFSLYAFSLLSKSLVRKQSLYSLRIFYALIFLLLSIGFHSGSGIVSVFVLAFYFATSKFPSFSRSSKVPFRNILLPFAISLFISFHILLLILSFNLAYRSDFLHSILHPIRFSAYSFLLIPSFVVWRAQNSLILSKAAYYLCSPLLALCALYMSYMFLYIFFHGSIAGSGDAMVRIISQFSIFIIPIVFASSLDKRIRFLVIFFQLIMGIFTINSYLGSIYWGHEAYGDGSAY